VGGGWGLRGRSERREGGEGRGEREEGRGRRGEREEARGKRGWWGGGGIGRDGLNWGEKRRGTWVWGGVAVVGVLS
jgi:hypothetical protein